MMMNECTYEYYSHMCIDIVCLCVINSTLCFFNTTTQLCVFHPPCNISPSPSIAFSSSLYISASHLLSLFNYSDCSSSFITNKIHVISTQSASHTPLHWSWPCMSDWLLFLSFLIFIILLMDELLSAIFILFILLIGDHYCYC